MLGSRWPKSPEFTRPSLFQVRPSLPPPLIPLTPRREAQSTAPVEARRQEEPRTGNHEACTRPLVCGLLAVGLRQVTFCSELQFVYKT